VPQPVWQLAPASAAQVRSQLPDWQNRVHAPVQVTLHFEASVHVMKLPAPTLTSHSASWLQITDDRSPASSVHFDEGSQVMWLPVSAVAWHSPPEVH